MKLLYASSATYPSLLANRIQTLSMAKEFAKLLGARFHFGAVACSENHPDLSILEVSGKRGITLAFRYLCFIRREGITHVFCRESNLLSLIIIGIRLLRLPVKCFIELHEIEETRRFWFAVKHVDGIIVVAPGLEANVRARLPDSPPIFIAPGAFDASHFTHLPSREEARQALGLPDQGAIVGYVGSFGFIPPWDYNPWKGADVLLDAAVHLQDCLCVFAGGEPEEVAELRRRYPDPNIRLLGQIPQDKTPLVFRAADVLVIPVKGGTAVSEQYTSPLKLFEYMASGTPIVASDLPSIRNILGPDEGLFFTPNDPKALAEKVHEVVQNREEAAARALRARCSIQNHTWEARAEHIIEFMKTLKTNS